MAIDVTEVFPKDTQSFSYLFALAMIQVVRRHFLANEVLTQRNDDAVRDRRRVF